MSRETFARAERALEKVGLIERSTPINGYRGRSSVRGQIAGISLAPLVGHLNRLIDLRTDAVREQQQLSSTRLEIRILRRAIMKTSPCTRILAQLAAMPKPSKIKSLKIAQNLLSILSDIAKKLLPNMARTSEVTSPCLKNDAPHIEPITNSIKQERGKNTGNESQVDPDQECLKNQTKSNIPLLVRQPEDDGDISIYINDESAHTHLTEMEQIQSATVKYLTDLGVYSSTVQTCLEKVGATKLYVIAQQFSKRGNQVGKSRICPTKFLLERCP